MCRQGNHGTGSRDFKVWKKEKEITKLKHTQNITYPEARRMVETTKYVKVTKKISQQIKVLYVWNKGNHKIRGGCPASKQNESANPRDENHHRSSQRKTLQRPKHQSCNKLRETGRQEELSSRTRTTPRKDRFEPMEMEASICQTGKIQMNTKMKNQEVHSKCPQEQSHW